MAKALRGRHSHVFGLPAEQHMSWASGALPPYSSPSAGLTPPQRCSTLNSFECLQTTSPLRKAAHLSCSVQTAVPEPGRSPVPVLGVQLHKQLQGQLLQARVWAQPGWRMMPGPRLGHWRRPRRLQARRRLACWLPPWSAEALPSVSGHTGAAVPGLAVCRSQSEGCLSSSVLYSFPPQCWGAGQASAMQCCEVDNQLSVCQLVGTGGVQDTDTVYTSEC